MHAPLDKRYVAQLIGEFPNAPSPTMLLTKLQIRIDRR
jgi:hypothetical protein